LPEAGGEAALYFEPDDVAGLGELMWQAAYDESVRQECLRKAAQHITQFSPRTCAEAVMQVYNTLV
jgi:glycosyltransferase involved in cell wall biosynthesis